MPHQGEHSDDESETRINSTFVVNQVFGINYDGQPGIW